MKKFGHLVLAVSTGLLCTILVAGSNAIAQQDSGESSDHLGEYQGAKETIHPDWFKESFLEFEEDIAEAADQGKRLVIYFHQNGCPYCNLLVEKNFTDPVILDKMQSNFDLVAINMWGDREVIQVGGKSFTEKTLAEALDVDFTPTLLFFSEDRKVVLRLNGYYPIVEFGHALDYVASKKEDQTSFSNYLANLRKRGKSGTLHHQDWIISGPYNLAELDENKPLAVLFEEPHCDYCTLLHTKTLAREDASQLLDAFNVVQLNRWSETKLVTPSGENLTAEEWARQLGLGFSPAIVFFDSDGNKIIAVDGMFKSFHILGVFDYVASNAYQSEPSFQRYLTERADRILNTGKDVNIWEY